MEINIHNIRFYEFEPKAIHCIEYNNEYKLLAVSRSDNIIEIWNCAFKPFKQLEYIGSQVGSIEALAWCKQTLFSAGQYDFIIEYEAESFEAKNQIAVTGGVTWCLAVSPNNKILAAGTEQGIVCLFTVQEDGLLYYKTLPRQEGRIFCVSWHPSSEYLVTGSIDFVHLYHMEKGVILQFPIVRATKEQKTIVWCAALLSDMTIVTGDSRGKTCFWNGEFGTLISGITTHQADVLTMRVTANQKAVYVAGIDPVIVEVQLADRGSNSGKGQMWIKSVHRRIHTHDVRAMALTPDEKLFTGGVDTYLTLSYYPPKTVVKFPAMPRKGYIRLAAKSGNILLGYENKVELWQLGVPETSDCGVSRYLPIKEDRVKLAEIHLKEKERLHTCAVSPEGKGIAYVVQLNVRIYEFTPPQNFKLPSIKRIKVPILDIPVTQVLWLDERQLLLASPSNLLQIITIEDSHATVTELLEIPSQHCAYFLASSEDKNYIVVADASNTIWVYNCREKQFRSIPTIKAAVTALAINSNCELFIAYSNLCLVEFDLKQHTYTQFGRQIMSNGNTDILKSNYVIQNISFHGSNKIFLHTSSSFIIVNKEAPSEPDVALRSNKIPRSDPVVDNDTSNSSVKASTSGAFSFVKRSNYVLHFAYLNKNDLVSVELNPIWLMDNLPPALRVKKFGAM